MFVICRQCGTGNAISSRLCVKCRATLGEQMERGVAAGNEKASIVLPEGCDFAMVAEEIREMLRMMNTEAASQGGNAYYKPEFLSVLNSFLKQPSSETAQPLLNLAPSMYTYFENCSPGGSFYETRAFLGSAPNARRFFTSKRTRKTGVFAWIAKKIDSLSRNARLGNTLLLRSHRWAMEGYSHREAEQQAKQELFAAMDNAGFSPVECSPAEYDAFCKAFLETPLNSPSRVVRPTE